MSIDRSRHGRLIRQRLLLVFGLLLLTGQALAGSLNLAWDAVAGATGYRLSYGTASGINSGSYAYSRDAGNKTSDTVPNLTEGTRYYFVVQAYDSTQTSAYSNEVSTVVPTTAAPPVASFTANGSTASSLSVTQGQSVTFVDTSTGTVESRSWTLGDGTTANTATVVKSYSSTGAKTVNLSVTGAGVTSSASKTINVTAATAPPTASFSASPVTGTVPLTVSFTDTSSGSISARSWNFGDGVTSSAANPVHTYYNAGTYTVTLMVSNSAGTDTLTRSAYVRVEAASQLPADALPMEFGELTVNDQWQVVSFVKSYSDPIVVAKPLSGNGGDPAVVRIDGIDANGFKIRVQEWDYLDGSHVDETLSYVVMERGRHQLPDGAWIAADRLQTSATNAFVSQSFSEPFTEVPIILAAITSVNELDAVDVRLRSITGTGFQVGMREQESNVQKHLTERIDYIALEPSFGVVNGVRYEADMMPDKPTHLAQTLVYRTQFSGPPLLLADMQTTAGTDTANLRWGNGNEVSVDLWVAEEQSYNSETDHVAESVGYLALEYPGSTQATASVCATPCSLWDNSTTPSLAADPDTSAIELGLKFRSDVAGQVTGVRFYKSSQNTGTHVGRLWSGSGQLLAQATFTNESASGWQQVNFPSPVAITANTTYLVSYHTGVGRYAVNEGYLNAPYTKEPLRALSNSEAGGNGVYRYGSGGVFPTSTYRSSNYWVDVVFQTP